MPILKDDGVVTSFGVFEVFSEPFVGLNKASVKSERQITVTSQYNDHSEGTLNATKHMQSNPEPLSWKSLTPANAAGM